MPWHIFNLDLLLKPDMQTMSSLPECACRIYHAVVCQQKPVDPCTVTLSHRAGCYHSKLLRTLPSNCLRFILDTPFCNIMSQWTCVCMCLSFCLLVCFIDRLVTHDGAQLKQRWGPAFTLQWIIERCSAKGEQQDHACAFMRRMRAILDKKDSKVQ